MDLVRSGVMKRLKTEIVEDYINGLACDCHNKNFNYKN